MLANANGMNKIKFIWTQNIDRYMVEHRVAWDNDWQLR